MPDCLYFLCICFQIYYEKEKKSIGNSPTHKTLLALSVHCPRDPHCLYEGPFSWYPCGHENEHLVVYFIGDVPQLPGEVLTRPMTVRAGHLITEMIKIIL